jgi:hypothetical protein
MKRKNLRTTYAPGEIIIVGASGMMGCENDFFTSRGALLQHILQPVELTLKVCDAAEKE